MIPPVLRDAVRGCAVAWRSHEEDVPPVAWQVIVARTQEGANVGTIVTPGMGGLVVAPIDGELWPAQPMVDLIAAALRVSVAVVFVYPDVLRAQQALHALSEAARPVSRTILAAR